MNEMIKISRWLANFFSLLAILSMAWLAINGELQGRLQDNPTVIVFLILSWLFMLLMAMLWKNS